MIYESSYDFAAALVAADREANNPGQSAALGVDDIPELIRLYELDLAEGVPKATDLDVAACHDEFYAEVFGLKYKNVGWYIDSKYE